jgi:hypothetical protein
MPDLTYNAGIYPISATATRAASDIMTLVHTEASPDTSLSVINGGLDDANVSSSWVIGKEYTQRGSSVDAFQAARTANLDWSWRMFGDWETGTDTAGTYGGTIATTVYRAAHGPSRPIPGCNKTFHAPFDGYALVMWSIFWATDSGAQPDDDPTYLSTILLTMDGVYQPAQMRHVGLCCMNAATSAFEPYKKARVWSGHAVVAITAGHHDTGLAIVADRRIRQTRTWAGSIAVLPFKYPGG